MKNHMLGEHGIGNYFTCDNCDFQVVDRGMLRQHINDQHNTKYETCVGNCSDRLYKENTFKCENCKSILCIVYALSDNRTLLGLFKPA